MPVKMTDEIEFQIKFTSTSTQHSNVDATLQKDMMSCKIAKDQDLSGKYWTSTIQDYNVKSGVASLDSNIDQLLLGQDWFVPADDIDLNIHQCTEFDTPTNGDNMYTLNYDC